MHTKARLAPGELACQAWFWTAQRCDLCDLWVTAGGKEGCRDTGARVP